MTPNNNDNDNDGPMVDIIISGIGGKLLFDGPLKLDPTLDNQTICQDAVRTILTAAREVAASSSSSEASSSSGAGNDGNKPTLIVLNTTGISDKRDLPFAMMPLYYWMLKVPHEDKKVMEALIRDEMAKPIEGRGVGGYAIVRPSLLTEGEGDGLEKVRVGGEEDPAVGYVIAREDVGGGFLRGWLRKWGVGGWGGLLVLPLDVAFFGFDLRPYSSILLVVSGERPKESIGKLSISRAESSKSEIRLN